MVNAGLVGVTILIILGLAMLFYAVLEVKPEEGFASAVMTIMLSVYITGLLGNTGVALILIYVLAVAGIIFSVVKTIRKKDFTIKNFFTPGIVMILGIVVVGVVAFDGMLICNWDELYQWAKAADYMVEFDQLASGEAFAGESVLLSSTTFFHYFIAKISAFVQGEITESNYYVSNLLLWFSAIALPFAGSDWKQAKRIFAFGVFHFLLASIIFVQPYYNIYTDQATAYWAGGMIAWLLEGKCKKKNVYLVPLVLINVGLMKSMVGPLFAVIVLLAVVVLYIASCKEKGVPIIPFGWKKIIFSKKGLLGIGLVASPFLLMGIWSVLTNQNGIFRYNGGVVNPGEEDRAIQTLKSMVGWIFESVNLKDDSIYLSYGIFIILTIALVYILYPLVLEKKTLNRYQSLMYVYILGFLAYFVTMFIAYMLIFGYTDSVRAMSLNRYFSDYMMLGVVPLTIPLFKRTKLESQPFISAIKKAIVVVFTLCIVVGISDYFLNNLAHVYAVDSPGYAVREELAGYCDEVKDLTGGKGKIYFVNQKGPEMMALVADYEMGDQLTRGGMCYKFREDTSEVILGLTEYPIEMMPTILREHGYEYLWVYSSNNYFKENMKEIFGVNKASSGKFYKVEVYEDSVKLRYIDTID